MTDKQPAQITPEEFDRMTDTEIVSARRAGQLDGLTGHVHQLSHADIAAMDAEAVTAAYQRGATATLTGARPPRPNPAQGGNAQHGPDPLVQLDVADLAAMSPEEVVKATKDGRLSNVLGSAPRPSIDHTN